jgi:hypothetical protein
MQLVSFLPTTGSSDPKSDACLLAEYKNWCVLAYWLACKQLQHLALALHMRA